MDEDNICSIQNPILRSLKSEIKIMARHVQIKQNILSHHKDDL
jgi:hypothetical protein